MPLFNPGIDATGGTITGNLSIGGDLAISGTTTSSGLLTAAAALACTGDATVTSGNGVLATAGKGLTVKEGTNARMGTGTLNGATEVTVNTTAVTASSRIFLSIEAPGGTPAGNIYVSARSAGTSFGVKGTALDTSTFAWMIVEPS